MWGGQSSQVKIIIIIIIIKIVMIITLKFENVIDRSASHVSEQFSKSSPTQIY